MLDIAHSPLRPLISSEVEEVRIRTSGVWAYCSLKKRSTEFVGLGSLFAISDRLGPLTCFLSAV